MFGLMRDSYERRLREDLRRWAEKGWIDDDLATRMLDDVRGREASRAWRRVPVTLGILGAVLIAAGVLMFVSANWQAIPRLVRLAMLLTLLWATLTAGVGMRARHAWLAEGMLLLAAAVFGGNVMLIAQMYHIGGHYPDALFLWGIGALAIAVLLESQGAMILSLGVLVGWAFSEVFDFRTAQIWMFLPAWLVAAGASVLWRWRASLQVAVSSLAAWLLILCSHYVFEARIDGMAPLLLLATMGTWLLVGGGTMRRMAVSRLREVADIAIFHGAAQLALVAFLFQIVDHVPGLGWQGANGFLHVAALVLTTLALVVGWRPSGLHFVDLMVPVLVMGLGVVLPRLAPLVAETGQEPYMWWPQALLTMGIGVWLKAVGARLGSSRLQNLGMGVFGVEVFYVYVRAFGGLLQTSVFFLLGGVLFILLGYGFLRLRAGRSKEAGTES